MPVFLIVPVSLRHSRPGRKRQLLPLLGPAREGDAAVVWLHPAENETVNSSNGNLSFTIPLVSRPGRAGLGVNIGLGYNSKFWEHAGGYATLAERDSWVGVGWTLVVARVIDDSPNGYYYVTLPDGSNHELVFYGGLYRSIDSMRMVYDPAAMKLTMKGGATYTFGYVDPLDSAIRYATRVQDTNGNYLEVNYSGSGGRSARCATPSATLTRSHSTPTAG